MKRKPETDRTRKKKASPAAEGKSRPKEILTTHHIKGRLVYLLISLISLILFYPFLEEFLLGNEFLIFMATIIPIAAFYAVSYERRHVGPAFFLAVCFIVFNWLQAIAPLASLVYLNTFFSVLFYAYITFVLLKRILKSRDIGSDTIFGAISVYLIIGIIFSSIYVSLEMTDRSSFLVSASDASQEMTWPDFVYFSYVTLTTTGYGDIMPRTSLARSITVIESMTGIFYVAILIAQLMGVYIMRRARNLRKRKERKEPEKT
ncbi:MAG: two pore domain potassium channel family protein [DPANN group archaeon]|nr:two pore domain potassium channel family protein [DPANN group archaeon]